MKLLFSSSLFILLHLFVSLRPISADFPGRIGQSGFILGENLPPWKTGLLQIPPVSEPAYAPNAKFPLILAAKQTDRPDILDGFRHYRGGWDFANRHYWASVGFTGAAGFVLATLWFVCFGLFLAVQRCCKWEMSLKNKGSHRSDQICLALLLVFTCAAAIGCILLSVGQDEFHDEMLHTTNFVVNQSDYTVEILRNVTEFLSLAETVNVDQVFLPSNSKDEIDRLNVDLNNAASTLTQKTSENSSKIRKVLDDVRYALIAVAAVMLLLALIGLLLSVLGRQHTIYIFILSGWLLVAFTFILCGLFVIVNNAISDTCTAMKEWVEYPQAETALSNILPCVDERTTNKTLYQSKEVIYQLVNVVNTAIYTCTNVDSQPQMPSYYNQSGPLMPPLCCPFDSQLKDRQCQPQEVSFANASMVWKNYTCTVSSSGICVTPGRVTPEIYSQLVAAVNVIYALDYYAPFLLSLQDCKFVRDTFTTITTLYCPHLEHFLEMVDAGLALISIGVMLCLFLWIAYANRPQREEVFAKLPADKVSVSGNQSAGDRVDSLLV